MSRSMTVGRLIEILSDYDEEATVYIGEQESWPFECSIAGVVDREGFEDEDEDDPEDKSTGNLRSYDDTPRNKNDVFIVEGSQVRYGSKNMWANV